MTDIAATAGTPLQLLPYCITPMPLPGWLVTASFAGASMVHFAADLGLCTSVLMHAGLTLLARRNMDVSFLVMSIYFCFVHTPMHYLRLLQQGQAIAVVSALVITAIGSVISVMPGLSSTVCHLLPRGARMLAPTPPIGVGSSSRGGAIHAQEGNAGTSWGVLHVTHMMQKLVVAHVLVDALHSISLGQPWLPPAVPPWIGTWR